MRFIPAVSPVRIQVPLPKKAQPIILRLLLGPLVKRLRHRPFTAVTWVRFPYGSPRRRKRYEACDDFLCFASKVISRSLRCPKGLALRRSSSPNQTRLRLGFDLVFLCPQNWPGVLHTSLREQNCIWHCFLHRTVVYFLCFHPSGAGIQLESAANRGKFSLRKGLFIMTRNMISASRIITTNIWRKKHEQHYPDKN